MDYSRRACWCLGFEPVPGSDVLGNVVPGWRCYFAADFPLSERCLQYVFGRRCFSVWVSDAVDVLHTLAVGAYFFLDYDDSGNVIGFRLFRLE